MKELKLSTADRHLQLAGAKRMADAAAASMLGACTCLSWFDRDAGREAPAHVSECRDDCDRPGWLDYAANRGAELKVTVNDGAYVFCYRSFGELA
jgi:hypothetical protein